MITRTRKRIENYNYGLDGFYYVTICSKDRKNIFGQTKNNEMSVGAALVSARDKIKLTIIGQIIDEQINDIPKQYNHVKIDEYVIMPNHVHMLMVLNNNGNDRTRAQTSSAPTVCEIIRSFKSKSSMAYLSYLKQNNIVESVKIWQRSFYDHIIRSDRSLNAIRKYITHNPENWEQDIENLINL